MDVSGRPAVRRFALVLVTVLAAGPLGSSAVAQTKSAEPDLSAARAALKKYEDPYVAVHDGYFSTLGCVDIPKAGAPGHMQYKPGAMGVHFFNSATIGPVADPAKPQVLLYAPTNPAVKCAGYAYSVLEEAPMMVAEPKP